MRATFVASLLLVSVIHGGTATAGECPPDALGVARTIVVDPREHARIGAFQYSETLPLNDKEVVLTFDDGPVPRHTSTVLETLASECTKATFFMVGQMANAYPAMVRRVHDEGHTIANHSQTHPFTFSRMSVEQAAAQIEGGFASLRAALGDPDAVAPFFRIPGLLRQDSVEQYLAAHGVMTWSVDAVADDWTHINAAEIARRAVSRLEARGKGCSPAARYPREDRACLSGDPQGTQGARLQDRARGAGDTRSAQDSDCSGAMGGAHDAGAKALARRGRHRHGNAAGTGIAGAEPGKLRPRRSSRSAVDVVLGAKLPPAAAARGTSAGADLAVAEL